MNLRRALPLLSLLAIVTGSGAAPARGAAGSSGTAGNWSADPCNSRGAVSTLHEITLRGHALRYLARAGFLPIRQNAAGPVRACIFFVSYHSQSGPHGSPRPLTFLWNGGPGAASAALHLEAFGPKRISGAPHPTEAAPLPLRLLDNESTLLDQSDLVFVDAVGTGFSRPTNPAYAREFYNVLGDIRSITDFVRVYRTRFDARNVPIYLVGESYGVWRAAGVAERLLQSHAPVAGLVLLSGGLPVSQRLPIPLRLALNIPDMTAAAFYFRKLPPTLETNLHDSIRAAANWASHDYAVMLAAGSHLGVAQRRATALELSRYTGMDPAAIDPRTLVISRRQFATRLLGRPGVVLAMMDGRLTRPQAEYSERATLALHYLERQLHVRSDAPYRGLFLDEDGSPRTGDAADPSVNEGWSYNQRETAPDAPTGHIDPTMRAAIAYVDYGPPGGHPPWVNRAFALEPNLRIFVAAGRFDSLNSCLEESSLVARLPHPLRDNIRVHCYDSGHMIYLDRDARLELRRDLRQFYATTPESH